MKIKTFILTLSCLLTPMTLNSQNLKINIKGSIDTVSPLYYLDGNNFNTSISNTGLFDAPDLRIANMLAVEWPKGSGEFAVASGGLTIAGYINNVFRMSSASYKGEYTSGYIVVNTGVPVAMVDDRFHLYKVKRGNNAITNPDWLNWGNMVPYGAPFIDVNHNGIYEPFIDTPGIRSAEQTIFACLTDGFQENHTVGEGFGGGTAPMFNELHLTAWCYNVSFLQDVQFFKWEIINKNIISWNNTYISIVSDPDLGCPNDDYIGCDTLRQLTYCYNGEPVDCQYPFRYTDTPPAVGFQWLNCSGISNLGVKSIVYFSPPNYQGPICETDPNGDPLGAYNIMRGLKKDATPWVYPPGGSASYVTKLAYSGDPETGTGWCEGNGNPSGSIWNCGGTTSYTGDYHPVNAFGDRRLVMSSGGDNYTIHPNDTVRVMIAQLIAQGTSNLNSVTKLKILSDSVKAFCNRGMVIGINRTSSSVPEKFMLYQNYPNPFNPVTKIKFSIPEIRSQKSDIRLIIYDVLGREVATLVNKKLQPGTYTADWNATNYPSGVYFYKLIVGDYTNTKKMVLVK